MIKYKVQIKSTDAYRLLKGDIDRGSISNGYMLISGDTIVRDGLVDLFASMIFCKEGGCGVCAACQKVLSGNHTSVRMFDCKDALKVEQVKQVIADSTIASIDGDRKLYIFNNAQSLSIICQNTLLKTLEEPIGNTTILFALSNENSMLATIKSRCKKVYIQKFDESQMREVLKGEEGQVTTAIDCADGELTRALEILERKDFAQTYNRVLEVLECAHSSKEVTRALMGVDFNKEFLSEFLNIVEILIKDMLLLKETGKKCAERVARLAQRYSTGAVANFQNLVCRAREKALANCNTQGIFDSLLFGILEVAYKCQ